MISTVISYCSLDRKFIDCLIDQAKKFSDDIVLVCYDHLLNGKLDNIDHVRNIPGVKTIVLPFVQHHDTNYLHNVLRWEGAQQAKNEWILMLDGDEIVEGDRFNKFIKNNFPFKFDASAFHCYWYFREPIYQSLTNEHNGIIVNKKFMTKERHFHRLERWIYREDPTLNFGPYIVDQDGPMLHHFSWVRTHQEMLDKVTGWGHKNDRNWVSSVNAEFNREFNGTDFVHGYQYRIVDNKFNIQHK